MSLQDKPAVPNPPPAAISGSGASPGWGRSEAGQSPNPTARPGEGTYHCSRDPSRCWRCCIPAGCRGGAGAGGLGASGGGTRRGPAPAARGDTERPEPGSPRLAPTGRRRGRRLRRESKFLLPRLPVMSRLPLLRGWARSWP